MKKLKIWGPIFAVLAIAVVLVVRFYGQGEASYQEYRTAKIQRGNIRRVVTSSGTVNPLNTVSVGSQVSGNVKEIFVDYNSTVTAGQTIALIDSSEYAAHVEQAKAKLRLTETQMLERDKDIISAQADVASAEASLQSAKASLQLTILQHERSKSLFEKKIVSKAELDNTKANLDKSQGALQVAEAKVQTAKAKYQRALVGKKGIDAQIADKKAALMLTEVKLKYCTILSPINGVVISRNVEVGQTVAATLSSPTLFTIAENLSRMQLEVDVSESDIGQIKQSLKIEFTVDAYPDKKFKAMVTQVRNTPTNIQNVVTYKVIASVENAQQLLRPGMTANVTIETAKMDDVLKVPNAAIRFKPTDDDQKKQQQGSQKIEDRPLFKNTVKTLNMDKTQQAAYLEILKKAGAKRQSSMAGAETDQDRRAVFRAYFMQVISQTRPLLNEEQLAKYNELLMQARERNQKRRGTKPSQVFITDEAGNPKRVRVFAGVANEIETQILTEDLKEGDEVIIGVVISTKKQSSGLSNPFMSGRRR